MCRVFASHTCPVCSRRGRPIVSWENEMAKRSLVEVYEEVSEVHHTKCCLIYCQPCSNSLTESQSGSAGLMQQWQYLVVCIKRCTLGWLNVSPYLWLLDSPCMHCFFLISLSALSYDAVALCFHFCVLAWSHVETAEVAFMQQSINATMCTSCLYTCVTARIKVRWISIHALCTYKHKLTVLQQ